MKERNNNSNDPEQDEREQMEVRLTALALGEASDFEAAELRRAMDADSELAEYYRRIEITAGIVREAANQTSEISGATTPRLSEERRNAILKRAKPQRTSFPSIIRFPRALPMGFAASLVLGIGFLYWALFRGVGDSEFLNAKGEYTGPAELLVSAPTPDEPIEVGEGAYSLRETINSSEIETVDYLALSPKVAELRLDELESVDLQETARNRSTDIALNDSLAAAQDNFASALLGEDFGLPTEIEERSEIHSYQNLRIGDGEDSLPVDTDHGDIVGFGFVSDNEAFELEPPFPEAAPKEKDVLKLSAFEVSREGDREWDGGFTQSKSNVAAVQGQLSEPERIGRTDYFHSDFQTSEVPAYVRTSDLVAQDFGPEMRGKNKGRSVADGEGEGLEIYGVQSGIIIERSELKRKLATDGTQAFPAGALGQQNDKSLIIDSVDTLAFVAVDARSDTGRGQTGYGGGAGKGDGYYRASGEKQTKNQLENDIGRMVASRRYEPLPEIVTMEEPFSTFSLNVSDVSFRLAEAALLKGEMPSPADIRSEEFLNALNYHDPAPTGGMPLAFHWERARSPFHHSREFLRISVQTASEGRERTRPLNLVLLIDSSVSMERADRQSIVRAAVTVLADALREGDRISVVAFDRTPHLILDGIAGDFRSSLDGAVEKLKASGATHLEGGLDLAYEVAKTQFRSKANNRVVVLTDGAANLGEVLPDNLRSIVAFHRKLGIALDCFGIGADGLNDAMLEALSRNGDGRYGFLNSVEDVETGFSRKLAGSLRSAASDVKVQVEFNPDRVEAYRQVGYRRHQLTRADFRDDAVDAAEIGEAEAGNALYLVSQKPNGVGPIATVRVRFRDPATREVRELSWQIPASRKAPALREANPSLRLAVCATMFAEWLAGSPYAEGVTPRLILENFNEVPEAFPFDGEPLRLREMIERAGAISGR